MPDAAPEAAPDFTARRSVRTALLATAGVSMLAGLYAALLLVVDREPTAAQRLPDVHGILMVLGFLGTPSRSNGPSPCANAGRMPPRSPSVSAASRSSSRSPSGSAAFC